MKVKFVQQIVRADGKIDLYFRKGGHRERLYSPPETQALKDEVDAILRRLDAAARAHSRPRAGTVAGVLEAYNRSAEFLALARSTQANYQLMLDELIEDCGQVLLAEVSRAWVVEMRDEWAVRGHRAANLRLQVLKNALEPIIADETDGRLKGDPFHKLRKVRRPHDIGEAHPIWEDAEIEAVIAEALRRGRPGLARAIAIGRWGGFRRGTICTLPLAARTVGQGADGNSEARLYWITEKRKVLCDKREDPRLTELLSSTPNRALTLAYNAQGQPWKARQLNQAVDRLTASLAAKGKVRAASDAEGNTWSPLTLHGLRHSRGVELAYNGASDAEIMAQLEHATDHQARIYRRQADRRRLADAAQDKVDNVVRLRASARAAVGGKNGS